MRFEPCKVDGAWVVEPEPHVDDRGRFMRVWCHQEFLDKSIRFAPVQGNMALSNHKGTIRGLHYQVAPALEAKLVRCTRGSIFDVVVDMRSDSQTYRQWSGTTLSATNGKMLLVPEGCAHGCLSLEDDTEIFYLASAYYSSEHVRGARFDDPALAIDWPDTVATMSDQDRNWPLLGTQKIGG